MLYRLPVLSRSSSSPVWNNAGSRTRMSCSRCFRHAEIPNSLLLQLRCSRPRFSLHKSHLAPCARKGKIACISWRPACYSSHGPHRARRGLPRDQARLTRAPTPSCVVSAWTVPVSPIIQTGTFSPRALRMSWTRWMLRTLFSLVAERPQEGSR